MIIIIDTSFPFEKGDIFLNDEINELIIPLFAQNTNVAFPLPNNVIINNCCMYNRSFGSRIMAGLRTIFDKDFWKDLAFIFCKKISIKRIAASFYYSMITNEKYYLIFKSLQKKEIEPRVIYTYWMHIHACIGAKLKKKFCDSRFLTRCHGYDLYEFRSSINYLPGRRLIFEEADHVLSVSHAGANYLYSHYQFLNNEKVGVSYLGTYDYGLNIPDYDNFTIVSCSNLVPVKRVNIIVEALGKILNENIHWIHYGDGELMNSIKSLAMNHLHENISYEFRGFLQHDELMREYLEKPIDVIINVSESEGLPVSIMEAMSFGIPAIATNVGGTKEIVTDGYNGYLLDDHISAEELARFIIEYYKMDLNKRNEIRKNARLRWEEKFNAKRNYLDFQNTYLAR